MDVLAHHLSCQSRSTRPCWKKMKKPSNRRTVQKRTELLPHVRDSWNVARNMNHGIPLTEGQDPHPDPDANPATGDRVWENKSSVAQDLLKTGTILCTPVLESEYQCCLTVMPDSLV